MEWGTIPTIFAVAIPVFVLTMLIEWRMSRGHDHGHGYEAKDAAASVSMGIGFLLIQAPMKGVTVAGYAWLYQHRLFDLEVGVFTWLMLLLAEDLCYYWYHRLHHTVRILWASHVNHHSSRFYNLSTALRQAWTSPFTAPWFWMVLPLLGFPVELILIQQTVSLLYQYWIHTELIGSMGVFGSVFNSPSHHRVHHGSNLHYLDKNYGGIFIIWDRLFGTFQAEDVAPVYGLTTNIESYNPVVIAFHEFAAAARDVWQARSWRARVQFLIGPPGWREDGGGSVAQLQEAARRDARAGAASAAHQFVDDGGVGEGCQVPLGLIAGGDVGEKAPHDLARAGLR